MKSFTLLLLLGMGMAACGCSSNASWPTVSFASLAPPHRDSIAEVKAYARVHHMYYRIFCTDWQDDPNSQFQADMCPSAECQNDWMNYHGKFIAGKGATQQSAADDLLDEISSDGWWEVDNRPVEQREKL